jgi:hypothetical protein
MLGEAQMALISNEFVQAPAFIGIVAAPNLYVTDETPADFEARENLLDKAFGAARLEKTVERLREGRLPAPGLALVSRNMGITPRGLNAPSEKSRP